MAVGPLTLTIRTIDAPGVPGGKALALCTEGGEVVGKQRSCAVESEATEIGIVTVRFYIDGETICFAANHE